MGELTLGNLTILEFTADQRHCSHGTETLALTNRLDFHGFGDTIPTTE